jgi:hypothetical protein
MRVGQIMWNDTTTVPKKNVILGVFSIKVLKFRSNIKIKNINVYDAK